MLDSRTILDRLNDAQTRAVTHEGGPLLILAGAGSGKTRVITRRIAWLIRERDIAPRELVAVTFTNKAAGEMRERVEALVGHDVAGAFVGTFHAFGLRILRANAVAAGYPPSFVIYDSADQLAVVRAVIKERGLDDKVYAPKKTLGWISRAKTALVDPEEAEGGAKRPEETVLAQIYREYEDRLRRAGALDFDDLLVKTIRLFRARPEIAERYASRTRHLLVDEYQDTNALQYALIRLLSSVHRDVCAVGDEDQSIYAFRGADIRNILDFEKDFPEATIVKLEQNYRSTGNVLAAASAVIRNNVSRHDKTLWTESDDGDKLLEIRAYDDRSEADLVVEDMLATARLGVPLDEIAVLYRTNATSRLVEDRLMARNVPYRVVGGLRFYERKEIKDLLAWLRMLVHPDSDQDFLRASGTPPRGVGAKTLEAVAAQAQRDGTSLHAAARALLEVPGELNARAEKALRAFLATIDDLVDMTRETSVRGTVASVIEAISFVPYLEKAYPSDYEGRAENLGALVDAAQEHDEAGAPEGLGGFLDRVSLRSDTDDIQGAKGPSLMTVHSAKGLEFERVYIVGMNEDLFPHPFALGDPDGIEEERRLMYVALTRAQESLVLTHARYRSQFGQVALARPSRFLLEIPRELLDTRDTTGAREPAFSDPLTRPARSRTPAAGVARRSGELSYEPDPAMADGDGSWSAGMRVSHPTFGPGIVMTVEGRGRSQKLKIRFKNGSLKKIMPAHTPLMPG